MDKYKDFPEKPRVMSENEAELYFTRIVEQIRSFDPKIIVGVARTGLVYAVWVAQELGIKDVGIYWPKQNRMAMTDNNPGRIVFVDDNTVSGSSYLQAKELMAAHYPQTEYRWAVLFTDWNSPEIVQNEVIKGARLPYFAEEPFWGSRKISKDYGIRFRDE